MGIYLDQNNSVYCIVDIVIPIVFMTFPLRLEDVDEVVWMDE